MSSLLREFELPISLNTFYETFWADRKWYTDFMTEELKDIKVNIGLWKKTNATGSMRDIVSLHPPKFSFPGLSSHAEVCIQQTMYRI